MLTSGAAYAGTASITIISATPTHGFGGTNLDVQVSTSGGSGGSFSVSGAGGGCSGLVNPISGAGSCDIAGVAAGNYSLVASYQGAASPSFPVTIAGAPTTPPIPIPTPPPTPGTPPAPAPTGNTPAFSSDSPPTSVNGQSYSYQFQASGSPSFELVGAPSWLSIGPDGTVSGTIPDGVTSFSYSVKAWNNFGFILAGPFNVFCHNFFRHEEVNLRTSLSCTSPVYNGQRGTCTLAVFNWGPNFYWGPDSDWGGGFAPDVTAQIALPWQLRADYCGYYQFWNWSSNYGWNNGWNFGCTISGNTAYEDLGTLYPGQTKYLTVTFTARTGFSIWGWHRGYAITVPVYGSAAAFGSFGYDGGFGNWNNFCNYGSFGNTCFFGQRQGFSTAYVTIIPRHRLWWW